MQNAVPSRHPKYRTKLCRNFASGSCPFGQKCSFVHPTPRTSPPSTSSQRPFNWNPLLLTQLLALSNWRSTRKEMPRRSQPQPQEPKLIEHPSPSTSLLLSKSDCNSSEQVPQTKRPNRRKKQPCKHFIRTGGWCPAAGRCKFYHDVAALASKNTQTVERPTPFTSEHDGEQAISGGVLMSKQVPSPQIINESHMKPPRCDRAQPLQPYGPMYWPTYTWQPYPSYYTAVPPTAPLPIPVPPPVTQHGVHPPRPPALTVPPTQIPAGLPLGSYRMNGTTYFPTSMPPVPAPASTAYPPYNPPMVPAYPCYAPPPLPAGCYDVPGARRTSFDPFASDPVVPSELPVIPRLEDFQISPIRQDDLPLASPFARNGDLGLTIGIDKPTAMRAHEFPYQPPVGQRVGHARRISVDIKKHVRANSG